MIGRAGGWSRALAAASGVVLAAATAAASGATRTRPGGAVSERPMSKHFRLVAVAPGSWAAIAAEGDRESVGNAGFVIGRTGVLVVDSFATAEAARELLAAIRRETALPVRWVVDTHYHLDHVGGNAVFREAGAVIVGDENVRRWARTENLKWRHEITAQDRAVLGALVLPEITSGEGGTITIALGDRTAEVRSRPGHTGGDLIVRVTPDDVVFAGDLFWKSTVPNLIDADTRAWVETLDGFLRDDPAGSFVPGHGEVGHALDVRFFRDYLIALRLAVAREIERGSTGQSLVDAALETLRPRYGAWTWFSAFGAAGVAQTEQELRGTKTTATHFAANPKELP